VRHVGAKERDALAPGGERPTECAAPSGFKKRKEPG
jgi:hypothetical protein